MRALLLVTLLASGQARAAAPESTAAAPAVDAGTDERYRVHVVVMSPGDALFSRWGHIALRVDDRALGTAVVYNYGTFDFNGSEDLWRYAQGYLTFRLGTSSWRGTLLSYAWQNRAVTVYTLALTPAQAALAAERLRHNALPANRAYSYRHYLDNCSTRVRDLVDAVLDGALRAGRDGPSTGRTYRDWTRQYLIGTPVWRALILFVLGPAIDRPITRWDEMFLPDVVAEELQATRLAGGRPLVSAIEQVVPRRGPRPAELVDPVEQVVILAVLTLLGLGLLAPLMAGARPSGRRLLGLGLLVWGLINGLLGLGLALMWCCTQHRDTAFNANLLAMPPSHLLLVVPGALLLWRARLGPRWRRLLRWYAAATAVALVLGLGLRLLPHAQDTSAYLASAAAGLVLLALGARRSRATAQPS